MSIDPNFLKELFLTSDLVPAENRKSPYDYPKKLKEKKKSLLLNYETEIKNIFEKKIPTTSRYMIEKVAFHKDLNKRLMDLNEVFQNILIMQFDESQYEIFAKLFTLYRSQNLHFMENADIYQKLIASVPKNISKNGPPIIYKNPIQIYNYQVEHRYLFPKQLSNIINKIPYNEEETRRQFILGISNLYFANYIDTRQPSIGPIYSIYEDQEIHNKPKFLTTSIFSMMMDILNGENTFCEKIPLKEMQIQKTFSRLLIQKKKKSFTVDLNAANVNFFSDEDERLMSMIENSIEGIQFTLDDVMKEDKKETSKVRSEYVLPYQKKSSSPFEIEKLKELSSVGDRTKTDEILKHNRKIIAEILNKKETDFKDKPENEDHIKNALAIYTYIAITLFYDCYKYYLNQISKIFNDMVDDDRFRKLNMEAGFDYLEKLNQSLYSMKKIMENCFYHMFLPSKLTAKYGISIHKEKGFYQIEHRMLSKLQNIYENFPFPIQQIKTSHANKNKREEKYRIETSDMRVRSNFVNFMLSHKFKVDIYNPKEELFIGALIMDEKRTMEIYKKFNEYFAYVYYITIFNQIIGDVLLKALYVGIPIEVFTNVLTFFETNQYRIRDSSYNSAFEDEIKRDVIMVYDGDIKKSTYYLVKLAESKKNLEVLNEKKQEHLRRIEESNIMSLLFYHKSQIIFDIFSEEIKNEKYRLKMIAEMKKETLKYEKLLIEKTKNIQQEVQEHRKELEEARSNTSNQSNLSPNNSNQNKKNNTQNANNAKRNNQTESFYQGLKKLLNKDDIYIPYVENGSIRYLSVFTDKNANQANLRNTQFFILAGNDQESISQKKLRVLKSDFVEKIKKVSSPERRSLLQEFLSNPEIYEKLTESVSEEDPLVSYMKEMNQKHGKEKSSLIFISEKQMQKITQMIES